MDARNMAERKRVAADLSRVSLSAYLRGHAEDWAEHPEDDEYCAAGAYAAFAEAAEKLEQAAQAAQDGSP